MFYEGTQNEDALRPSAHSIGTRTDPAAFRNEETEKGRENLTVPRLQSTDNKQYSFHSLISYIEHMK